MLNVPLLLLLQHILKNRARENTKMVWLARKLQDQVIKI